MKILITGANGFIGSYLANYFLRNHYEVTATSRRFHESIKRLLSNARLVEADVLIPEQLNSFSSDSDILIHTATANDIISKDSLKGVELSAIGTKNILDFAAKNKIGRCIIFSTLQVYGIELHGEINENSPLNYQNDYGLNHLFAEMYAEMYSRQNKIQCVSVRPANIYGRILTDTFNRWSLVPGCFCKEAYESGTITIKSSGRQMRNFINLENLSRSVECIAKQFPDNYECFNLASSQVYSMLQVAEKVKRIYESKFGQLVHLNIAGTEPKDANHFSVRLEKLKSIGFTENDHYTLETEIGQIFNYLKAGSNNEPD